MPENHYHYVWRCVKCGNHFASIVNLTGDLRQEKKCPKCKALNILHLTPKEITITCREPEENEQELPEQYSYGG